MKKRFPRLLFPSTLAIYFLSCLFTLPALRVSATTYVSNVVSGSWNTVTSWLPNGTPTLSDNVTILAGSTITMNAAPGNCNNLSISGTLTWSGANTLNVGGNLTLNSGGLITGSATGTLKVTGTFTAGAGSETIDRNAMTITSNSTFNGVVTYTSATGGQTFTGNVTFNNGSGITFSAARSVAFSGNATANGTVTIGGSTTGTITIGNALTVSAASTLNMAQTNLTVTGSTTLAGSLVYNDANGTKIFGDVSISGGGTWDCSGYDMNFRLNGNLANSGTFNPSATTTGPNEYRFTSATAAISGTLTIRKRRNHHK